MAGSEATLMNDIRNLISTKQAVCFIVSNCENCRLAESKLKDLKLDVRCVYCDSENLKDQYKNVLFTLTDKTNFPYIFINGQPIGGYDDLCQKLESGSLQTLLSQSGRDVPVS